MKKYIKMISWFLGVSMFMFGILKFINPFKEWYTIQVYNSNLGDLSYAMGILGEISVGVVFILVMLYRSKLPERLFNILINGASVIIIIMMITAFYVHFHPGVPTEALPLKIKPPLIPGFFMLLAFLNIYLTVKNTKRIPSTI